MPTPTHVDIDHLTIADALRHLADGSLSSEALVSAYLERARAHAALNIFITLDGEGALAAARAVDAARRAGRPLGPLAGIPVVVKDNIHVAGLPATSGTRALANFVPAEDAPVVRALREAGAIVLGKTNMHELAFGGTGYNAAFHVPGVVGVRNPYDPARIAGGSSSGSAAALGARMAPAALGTDTGGSMRIPPALNGCSSLRPSARRYPSAGIAPIASSRDTAGPMALCMADVALLDGLITGEQALPPVQLKTLRLGVVPDFWANMDDEVAAIMAIVRLALEGVGVTFVEVDDIEIMALNNSVGFPVVFHEAYPDMVEYLATQGPGISIAELRAGIASPDVAGIYDTFVLPRKALDAAGNIVDSQAPTLLAPAPFEVGTDGFLCSGTVLIPVATATDNCSSVTVTPSWEFGSGFGPFYGIPEGQHLITYTAEDACGNQSTATTMVTVLDNTPPQAICSADLQVALSASGLGLVQATTIDAGSFDNCSPVFLSISRDGVEFQPQIQVNCQDQGSPLLLTLRVLDASGLENFCETEVNVRDFLKPTLVCPPNLSLNCLQDYNDTGLTGQASGSDNCALQSITYQDISNIQPCNIGSLTRWWTATDAAGNTKSCSQLISVEVVNGATVAFPQDVLLQSCAQPTDLEPLATGQPIIGGQMCSPLSVNYTDQVFNAPAPSCYRIFRHWKVIDHCVYNPNGGSVGIWEHTQLIDVQDQTAPQLVLPSDITMQADPATQQAVVNVPDVEALDCSAIQLLQHNSAFASNPLNASGAYPVGEHWITFSAMDACGNQAQQTLFIKVTPAYVPDPVWQVGGQLRNESGIPVRNVPVMLFADGFYAETSADTNGVFGFDDVPDSLDYTLQPFNNANWRNGVTTYDLVLISKHILGLEPLNSPFRMLAADANLSGSITTFDILQLRKLILGITDSLPNNQSWRFVRSGYVFPDSLNPFTNPVPEQIYLPALHQQQFGQDFTGIKIGDVNGSSNPAEARELRDTSYLTCEDQQVHAGQVLEVPIVMGGWAQADGFQFGLSVNPAQFELLNPIFEQPQLLNETHVNRTGTQVLRFSWNQSYGSATPKQDTLFKLQLRAKTNGSLVGGVTLDHNDMAAEAYTPAGDFALGLRVKTTPDVALPQPLKLFPNPSTGVFFIQNPHPGQEMDCRVYNQLGQLVWEQSGNTAELIQVVLSTQDSQLYQVECSSRERTYSGKVLVQQL